MAQLRPVPATNCAQRDEHEQEQHAEVQEDDLDRDRREVDERGALAPALSDREEQHALPDVDGGVEEHQECANDQDWSSSRRAST